MRLLAAFLPLALAACGQMAPSQFYTKDGDQDEIKRERYACERDARMIPGDACLQMRMYEDCMRSKGFKQIPNTGNKWLC